MHAKCTKDFAYINHAPRQNEFPTERFSILCTSNTPLKRNRVRTSTKHPVQRPIPNPPSQLQAQRTLGPPALGEHRDAGGLQLEKLLAERERLSYGHVR